MSTSVPTDPNTPAATAPAPAFDETLRKFWAQNQKLVYIVCVAVLLAIIGRGAFEYYQRSREEAIAAEYAEASSDAKLKSFAQAHPDHDLAGAAYLRLADDAYASGKYADSAALYQKAAEILKQGSFGTRASIGAALSKNFAGQVAEGEEKLKLIANDAAQVKVARAEAAYHLGTLAADTGRLEDAAKYFDQASALDPDSFWARRAAMQRTTIPISPAALAAPPSLQKK